MQLHKITLYVLNFEGTKEEEVRALLANNKYLHVHAGPLETAEIGPWDDDHELNKRGADFEKYFRKE